MAAVSMPAVWPRRDDDAPPAPETGGYSENRLRAGVGLWQIVQFEGMARRKGNRALSETVRGDNAGRIRTPIDVCEDTDAAEPAHKFAPVTTAIEPGDIVKVRFADSIGEVHLHAFF